MFKVSISKSQLLLNVVKVSISKSQLLLSVFKVSISNSQLLLNVFYQDCVGLLLSRLSARARAEDSLAQGRPMGALLALLNLRKGCPGTAMRHRKMWDPQVLTEEFRTEQRRQAVASGGFEACFCKERCRNAADNADGEPRGLVRAA